MHRLFKTAIAAAALALSLGAQALSITPQTPALALTPGGEAVAKFDVDFGDNLEFLALQIDFLFDTGLLAGAGDSIVLSYAGTAPDFSGGSFVWGNDPTGATLSWVTDGQSIPVISGTGVLSIKLSDLALAAPTLLSARLTVDDTLVTSELSIVPIPVPEPATWVLALAGGCLLIAVRRRSQ